MRIVKGDVPIKVKRLYSDAKLPRYATEGASGMDVCACLDEPMDIPSGMGANISIGLAFEIPPGLELQVRPRSGLALKYGITLLNSPGTIDSDYRGEVRILLENLGKEPFTVNNGDRIAQLVLAPVLRAELIEAVRLSGTKRGGGGFGSTGV
jgi:dUTP pyrophosphatase